MVSVIIPLYNREKLIQATLDSILSQNYIHWECIIVDDHSTDSSLEIVQEFASIDTRIKCVKRPNKLCKGANSCRNFGLEMSKGDYILFLDSDDLLLPFTLNDKVHFLEANKEIVGVISKGGTFNHLTKQRTGEWGRTETEGDWITNVIQKRECWGISNALWRRECLPFPCFNKELQAGQDYEFHARQAITFGREKFYQLSKCTVLIREGHDSIGTVRNNNKGKLLNYAKARLIVIQHLKGEALQLRKKNIPFLVKKIFQLLTPYLRDNDREVNEILSNLCLTLIRYSIILGLRISLGLLLIKIFNKGYFLISYDGRED